MNFYLFTIVSDAICQFLFIHSAIFMTSAFVFFYDYFVQVSHRIQSWLTLTLKET